MVQSFMVTIKMVLLHLCALSIVWVLCMIGFFLIGRWGFPVVCNYSTWMKVTTVAIGVIAGAFLLTAFIPVSWTATLWYMVVPCFLQAIALHCFYLSFVRWMDTVHGLKPRKIMHWVVVGLVYGFSLVVLVAIHQITILSVSKGLSLVVEYTTKIALMGIVIIDVFLNKASSEPEQFVVGAQCQLDDCNKSTNARI